MRPLASVEVLEGSPADVVITCRQMAAALPHLQDLVQQSGLTFDIRLPAGQQFTEDEMAIVLERARAVIAGDDPLGAAVLERAPELQHIARWGIGMDSVDLAAAARLGITVSNTPGVFGNEVADLALGLLIGLARGIVSVHHAVLNGDWVKFEGRSLNALEVGVVGLGDIGRAFATRAMACGMTVVGSEPDRGAVQLAERLGVRVLPFDELVPLVDVVVLCCPLNSSTHHLIDERTLRRMRRGVLVINVSRGPVVKQDDLVSALETGQVGGAGLDVFEVEPLEPMSELRRFPNVILGAHNGSNTREAVLSASRRALANVIEGLLAV